MAGEYIAIDFETTGLDSKKSEVVEIGAVRFRDNGEIIDTFQSLAKPKKPIPSDAEKIHGITNEMVQGMAPPRVVWDKFLAWAGDFTALVAHNAEFESLFIQEMYGRDELIPEIKIIDTLRLSKNRIKNLPSYKLTDLVGGLQGGGHRALPDAHACIEVFMRSAKTYKSGKVPRGTYAVPVAAYKYVDPYAPTKRQLDYIRDLGGNPKMVSTRESASRYIDRLKSEEHPVPQTPATEEPFSGTVAGQVAKTLLARLAKAVLFLVVVFVGWIIIFSQTP
jgi:DNA polymerase-3 subunit alpha (Gram-positive type)